MPRRDRRRSGWKIAVIFDSAGSALFSRRPERIAKTQDTPRVGVENFLLILGREADAIKEFERRRR